MKPFLSSYFMVGDVNIIATGHKVISNDAISEKEVSPLGYLKML